MKEIEFKGEKCIVKKFHYSTGNLGLKLVSKEDGMPVMSCTICMNNSLRENQVIIKDYSENKGIYNALLENNLIKAYSRRVTVGLEYGLVCNLNF